LCGHKNIRNYADAVYPPERGGYGAMSGHTMSQSSLKSAKNIEYYAELTAKDAAGYPLVGRRNENTI
jgi:hypothetical protein